MQLKYKISPILSWILRFFVLSVAFWFAQIYWRSEAPFLFPSFVLGWNPMLGAFIIVLLFTIPLFALEVFFWSVLRKPIYFLSALLLTIAVNATVSWVIFERQEKMCFRKLEDLNSKIVAFRQKTGQYPLIESNDQFRLEYLNPDEWWVKIKGEKYSNYALFFNSKKGPYYCMP